MFKKNVNDPFTSDLTAPFFQNAPTTYTPIESIKEELLEKADEPEIYISEHVKVEGTISFDRLAKIDGHFTGEIVSKGKMIIGPKATICADLFLEEVVAYGAIEGNISVTKKLTLCGEAKVTGDITAPSLSVADGVSIRGQMHVMKKYVDDDENSDLPF